MNEHFHKGYRQAERVAEKEPHAVGYWLDRARRSRRRWRTWLFDVKKRSFLNGFILSLERSLEGSKPQPGQAPAPPLEPEGRDIDIEASGDWALPREGSESLRL